MKFKKQTNTLWDGAAALGILNLIKTLPYGTICRSILVYARMADSYHKIPHVSSAALLARSPGNQNGK